MHLYDMLYDIVGWFSWRKILIAIGVLLLLVIVGGFGFLWYVSVFPDIPPYRPIEQYVYLHEKENDPRCLRVDGNDQPIPGQYDMGGMPPAAFDNGVRKPSSSYQGWCETERQTYYRTPQGTTFFGLRYDWVANLERPVGKKTLMTRKYMESIGFIYDGAGAANPNNPKNLPIGLTWHWLDSEKQDHKILDFTCAACHSSQFTYQGTALQIDGGSGGHSLTSTAPSQFIVYNIASMFTTLINPFKFDRFADKVLADMPPKERRPARREMRSAMWATIGEALTYALDNKPSLYPTLEGYGRTDGLGRIVNTVFADYLSHKNYRVADAPVNYPHLWDIWGFDWVQWMGSVKQAMARNVNESLGVRARVNLRDKNKLFDSTAMLSEMHCIETSLQHLVAPLWPQELFGKVDQELAEQGQVIFTEVCQSCHGPFLVTGPDDPDRNPTNDDCKVCHGPWGPEADHSSNPLELMSARHKETHSRYALQTERSEYWKMLRIPIEHVGTDATSAINFINNTYDLSALKDSPAGKAVTAPSTGATDLQYITDWTKVAGATGLRFIGGEVRFKQYGQWGIWDVEKRQPTGQDAVDDVNGWGALDRPLAKMAYRPRPLEGVWATAPFLHNGSVPSLYELLLPADERKAVFYLGRREYDPVNMGIRTEKFPGAFKFDTSIRGNSNLGHEFDDGLCGNGVIGYEIKEQPGFCRQFTEHERMAILEYLKIHSDQPWRMSPGSEPHCKHATWPEGWK